MYKDQVLQLHNSPAIDPRLSSSYLQYWLDVVVVEDTLPLLPSLPGF